MTKADKKGTMRTAAIALGLIALFAAPSRAHAQCEVPPTATAATQSLAVMDVLHINQYLTQELAFTQMDLGTTATNEVASRFDQFNDNILAWLNNWWENSYLPAMKDQTKQLSTAELDQSRAQGSMGDASLQNEILGGIQSKEVEARRRAAPSDTACQVDTMGKGQTKGYRMARAVARGLANDAQAENNNRVGSSAETGSTAQVAKMFDDYENLYCDPAAGDQGCATAGPQAGRNNDFPGLFWGDKQTIDTTVPGNATVLQTVTRNVAGPFAPNPLPRSTLNSAQGKAALMSRRSHSARLNTINNAIGQMAGERIGGTGVDTSTVRQKSGTQTADASTDASYREIATAATRDRFTDPEYLFLVANYPEAIVREQGAINAIRLQQLSDLYKRTEELVFVEAAMLGSLLDQNVPKIDGLRGVRK